MQVQQKTTERNTFLEENLAKVRLRFSQKRSWVMNGRRS